MTTSPKIDLRNFPKYVNVWNEFQHEMGGKGLSRKEMSDMFKEVDDEEKLRLYIRGAKRLSQETASSVISSASQAASAAASAAAVAAKVVVDRAESIESADSKSNPRSEHESDHELQLDPDFAWREEY